MTPGGVDRCPKGRRARAASASGARRDTLRRALFAGALAWTAGGLAGSARAASAQELEGVWEVVERSYQRGDSSWVERDPQPGRYIFTERYYGVQEIRESGPRRPFDARTTDAERLAAFDVFHAHGGAYRVDGDRLLVTPVVAKGPNTMTGETFSYTIEWRGELLRIVRDVPGEVRVTTLRRIE